jgi:hypothetical protein
MTRVLRWFTRKPSSRTIAAAWDQPVTETDPALEERPAQRRVREQQRGEMRFGTERRGRKQRHELPHHGTEPRRRTFVGDGELSPRRQRVGGPRTGEEREGEALAEVGEHAVVVR